MHAWPAGRAAPRVAEPDPTGTAAWRRYEPWGILGARTNAARDFAPVLPKERGKGVASINQNAFSDGLPDFRNLGVIARVLIGVHLLAFGAVLTAASGWDDLLDRLMLAAGFIEPILLASLFALVVLSPVLMRMRFVAGAGFVLVLVLAITALAYDGVARIFGIPVGAGLAQAMLLAAIATVVLLGYLRLANKAYSPALAEARLQALQARIRPHFLFNSLNAVLSLIRRDPVRAERALEDLADLFRTLMSDARQFVHLADEIALLERYASLEQLRLGERLRIVWELDAAPADAILPPLVLQPLLENAVYHGVEPSTEPAEVVVRIAQHGSRLRVLIENPYAEQHAHHAGNRMAIENIRERLMLFFDAEARLSARIEGKRYIAEIEMPYRPAPKPARGAEAGVRRED
jgi:two-component system sensor histidine kinase AlgZ